MRFLVLLLTLFALLPAGGCSKSGQHEANERYVLVATNVKIPYWQAAANGLSQAASNLKVHAEMVGPDRWDPKGEVEEFRKAVRTKPAGILVSVADPELLRPEIDAAVSAGIPVITMDSDAPGSRRLLFIGTNNYQAGVAGAKALAKQLGGKGNVVVFTIAAQPNLEERLRGYKDALVQFPRISIVQVADIRGNPELAFDKTMEVMEKSKSPVDAFVCLEATAGKEVAEVLDRKKIRDKVVIAMDADEGTLEWIEKGGIAATIAQRPYTMAYYGVKMLDDLHHNALKPMNADWGQNPSAPIPAVVDTGSTLVDRTNVAAVRSAMGSPATNAAR